MMLTLSKYCLNFLLLGCLIAASTVNVRACECMDYSVAKAKKRSKIVFVGTVTESLNDWGAKFAIEKLWKGNNVSEVVVYSNHGLCSASFESGKTYLVYAYWDEEAQRLETDVCMRTRPINYTWDLEKLGKPKVIRTWKATNK